MSSKKFVLIFLISIFPLISYSCDLCGCFIPQNSMTKGFQIGIAEQYSSFSDLLLEGQQLANTENQYLNSSFTQFLVSYQFNERYSLQVNIPLIYRSFQRVQGNAAERGTSSGIGDVLLIGTYIPFQRKNPYSQFSWKVLGGLKAPTGNSSRIGEELNESPEQDPGVIGSGVHGHDIALGSGSWDGLVGTAIFGRSHDWFYTGHIQYSMRTRGDFNYRYANDLLWYGGPGYYLARKQNLSVGLQALLTGEHKGEDQLGNEKTDDTAITSVYFGPSAIIGLKQIAMAEVGIGFPLTINNSGLQTVPKYRLRIGVTWEFH